MSADLRPGVLLVAAASLTDPNFSRSLVLLLDTGPEGALGVVLNRPLGLDVHDVLEPWAPLVVAPGVLHSGGPVGEESALALGRLHPAAEAEPVGWRPVYDDVGLVDLDTPVELFAGTLSALRIYAGYAGWSAGQLEAEIAEGAWHVVPAEPDDPFAPSPARLWGTVLRRQGGTLAMLATQPQDPELN